MKSTWGRIALLIVGFLCVGLGAVGIFLPLLPTTPFLLAAAFCFARSSERFHSWLMTNRWFGAYIRDYAESRSIAPAARFGSLSMLWITLALTGIFFVESWALRALLAGVGVGVTVHLVTLRTARPAAEAEGDRGPA